MKTLRQINLVQFYLFDNEQLDLAGAAAFIGDNGSGKSTMLDAIQTVMIGAHGSYLKFNAQSSSNTSTRTLKGYCLGVLRNKGHGDHEIESMAREHSMSYLALGFCDDKTGEAFTAGLCMSASVDQPKHTMHGMFVLPGVILSKEDFTEQTPEGERPLAWGDFSARVSRRCRDMSRTAMIKDKTEAYVGELLAQLGPPTARIDQRAYMRSFSKAMQLRDIESVDEYVRQHIVPLVKIDVQDFGVQIKQFEEFKGLIEATKRNIKELEGIKDHYGQARRALVREMSLYSLAAIYEHELSQQRLIDQEDRLVDAQTEKKRQSREADATACKLDQLDRQQTDISDQITADPDLKSHESLSRQAKHTEAAVATAESQVLRQISPLIQGLMHLDARADIADDQRLLLRETKATLHKARENLANIDADALMRGVVDAGGLLRTSIKQFKEAARNAADARSSAKNELTEYGGTLRSLQQGQLPLAPDANRAALLLAEAQVEASPVCYLIKVIDPDWQPAIEAYLASQLDDFIVAEGQEGKAVALIRNLPKNKAIYNVKVAQPRHLLRFRHQQPASDEVARLVTSDNWIAQAFTRRALSNVKFAETEADLARSERALSKDGMVSSGGGTTRKRLPEAGQLRIGHVSNAEQLEKANNEHARLTRVYEKALAEDDRLSDLVGRINNFSGELAQEALDQSLSDLYASRQRQANLLSQLSSSETQAGQALLLCLANVKEQIKQAHERDKKLTGDQRVSDENISRLEGAIQAERNGQEKLHSKAVESEANPHCDPAVVDKYRQRIDEQEENEDNRADRARALVVSNAKTKDQSIDKARFALRDYEHRGNISLGEQLADWKKGEAWVAEELGTLESSNLASHEKNADEALAKAHDAFRRDIAYKLYEQMEHMKSRLHDLNSMLDRCPVFSQGERYRFKYQARKRHSKLRDFIERVSTAGDESQLSLEQPQTEPEIQEAMQELTAMATNPDIMDGKAPSVLTDYREFYSFDLAIRVNDAEVDTLSNRTGSGSGGEHRTPFYVIAGASLASAYRLDQRPGEGGGLMLLDEAFYSMDEQNALSAARFLGELGLQLVMAAPGADEAKIDSFTNTVFDIGRDGLTPWIYRVYLKEPANKLLISDFPSEHPDLIDEAMRKQQPN